MIDFLDILKENELITERDVNFSFNLAKISEMDETHHDDHLNMKFTEFIEAICRLAEFCSYPPFTEID
jgi:hypothetical protein